MRKNLSILALFIIFSLFIPHHSFAQQIQINPAEIPDNIFERFQDIMKGGNHFQTQAVLFAKHLFFGLLTISFFIQFLPLVLKEATMEEFVGELLKWIITMGFFIFLIENGYTIGQSILNSFLKMAQLGLGTEVIKPSTPIYLGMRFYKHAIDSFYALNFYDFALRGCLFVVGVIFLLLCTFTSINLLITTIEAYIVIYAGVIFLGFGVATWSRETIINYFKGCINYGARMFTLILVVDVCMSVLDTYANTSKISLYSSAEIIILGLIMYIMSNKLPSVVGGMIGVQFGTGSHAGEMASIVKTAVETGAKVAGGATTGGAGTAAMMAAEKLAGGAQGSVSGSAPTSMPPPPPPPTP